MADQVNQQKHFLLVTFPAQGHINPSLQFAKRLILTGAHVTFVTTLYGHNKVMKNSALCENGIIFAPFSDGYDDGFKPGDDIDHFISELSRCGSSALTDLAETFGKEGRPVTCLIYTILLPWASHVAHKCQLPSAFLWIQPAAVFDIYYYYFNGYREVITENVDDHSYKVELPGLPLLKAQDLPSFFLPSNPYAFGLNLFEEQFELLRKESKSFPVLVNTFDELEPEYLHAVENLNLIGIGPLIPSSFLDNSIDSADSSKDYIEWLDSKDRLSVVYVSFGTVAVLSNKQMEELARGFVNSGRSFLWVIRTGENGTKGQVQDKDEDEEYRRILRQEEHKGMIVPWCSQVEVLNHPSIGCFFTHCGWNSTLETLAMGVPVVAFPQWSDQGTNAKLIEDVWKMGLRVRPNEEDKIVTSEEIVRCLKQVMEGERGEEFRVNAKKWKASAREAVKKGGSSDKNLAAFVEDIGQVV